MSVVPNGQERVVGPQELFFSTTDGRGVITSVNSVFEKFSVYTEAELVGSPHNILRHPEMPAGIFELIWQRLLTGRPAVAYIKNLAKDGVSYWTLATLTPLADGFLSVRSAPANVPLHDAVTKIYADTLTYEAAAAQNGANRKEVAKVGAEYFSKRLAAQGYADFDQFVRSLLPSEVSKLPRLITPVEDLIPSAGRLQEMLKANRITEASLHELFERLDEYVAIARELEDAKSASATLDEAVSAAAAASPEVSQTSPVLAKAGQSAVTLAQEMIGAMQRLTLSLEVTRELVLDLRYRIALARLHTDMISGFLIEVASGRGGAQVVQQVTNLIKSFGQGISDVDSTLQATNDGLLGVAEDIAALDADFTEFQRMLATWRQLVVRFRLSEQLADKLEPIDRQLNSGMTMMQQLRQLGEGARTVARPVDTSSLFGALQQFQTARAMSA